MTRMRVWLLTLLAAFALALNVGLLSPRIAQTAEDTVRARLAAANNALRAQIELRDARLSPRLAASSPELIDALKPPADPTLPVPKPDEHALRAAAGAAQPTEPDLLIVATADGAVYTERRHPAVLVDDVKDLPLVKAALDGTATGSQFATLDGALFRVHAAHIPGSTGVVVTGLLIDDRLATTLRTVIDADVTFFKDGAVVASSLRTGREELAAWAKNPAPGYGTLPLRLPLIGGALDGKLPRGASRFAVRAVRAPMEGNVMAALTIAATPHFGWIGRYQAMYGFALLCFLLIGLVWGILPGGPSTEGRLQQLPPPRPTTIELPPRDEPRASEELAQGRSSGSESSRGPEHGASGAAAAAPHPSDDEPAGWGNLGESARPKLPDLKSLPALLETPPALPADLEPLAAKQEPLAGLAIPAPSGSDGPLMDERSASSALDPFLPPPLPGASGEHERSLDEFFGAANADLDPTNPRAPSHALLAQARGEDSALEPAFPPAALAPLAELPLSFGALAPSPQDRSALASLDPDLPPAHGAEESAAHVEQEAAAASAALEAVAAHVEPEAAPAHAELHAASHAEAEPQAVAHAEEAAASHAAQEAAVAHAEPEAAAAHAEEAVSAQAEQAAAHIEEAAAAHAAQEAGAARDSAVAHTGSEPATDQLGSEEPAEPAADPDEPHFRETYDKFSELRRQTGEPPVTFDKFAAKLRKNRQDLLAKHSARGVRFSVYLKDGRAAIKAAAIR